MDSDYLASVVDEIEWHHEKLEELFPLLEIAVDQPPEKMALLLRLYIQLSEPHREDIPVSLARMKKLLTIGA